MGEALKEPVDYKSTLVGRALGCALIAFTLFIIAIAVVLGGLHDYTCRITHC